MNRLRGEMERGLAMNAQSPSEGAKSGFTVIEVMLVLAITGLMLVGILGGTYSSIATQRYNDSVRSFSEFLRELYSEVISPQSLSDGNSDESAIYGKIAVFGLNDDTNADDVVYTATLIGNPHPPEDETNFLSELKTVRAKLYCGSEEKASTVDEYIPMWNAKIDQPNPSNTYSADSELADNVRLKGTLMIVRSPATGVVHTAFSRTFVPNLKENCRPDAATDIIVLGDDPTNENNGFVSTDDVDFCIVSDNSRVVRDIRLAPDGHNSSAINLIPADGDVKCKQK